MAARLIARPVVPGAMAAQQPGAVTTRGAMREAASCASGRSLVSVTSRAAFHVRDVGVDTPPPTRASQPPAPTVRPEISAGHPFLAPPDLASARTTRPRRNRSSAAVLPAAVPRAQPVRAGPRVETAPSPPTKATTTTPDIARALAGLAATVAPLPPLAVARPRVVLGRTLKGPRAASTAALYGLDPASVRPRRVFREAAVPVPRPSAASLNTTLSTAAVRTGAVLASPLAGRTIRTAAT